MSKTNLERLPELLASKAAHEANLRDILGAFRDKVKALREQPDPETDKSVADMITDEKQAIAGLEKQIVEAWQFPNQLTMDFG